MFNVIWREWKEKFSFASKTEAMRKMAAEKKNSSERINATMEYAEIM